MKIKSAEFVISNTDYKLCPKESLAEYAFIGRSNVGKSSLINGLVDRKNLAKTSGKPGKTQLINHYKINNNWFLVDLPGYGYASTSKKNREMFKGMINKYLINRENLICLFVLLDIRHKPQDIDLEFMMKMGWAYSSLPWFAQELEETRKLMGSNFYSYGLKENRKTLETLLRYSHDQGLAKRKLSVDELFVSQSLGFSEA